MLKIVMTSSMKNDPEKYVRECESEYSERDFCRFGRNPEARNPFYNAQRSELLGQNDGGTPDRGSIITRRAGRPYNFDRQFLSEPRKRARSGDGERGKDRLRFGRRAGPRTARGFSNKIEHGQPAEVPHFDFASGKSLAGEKITPKSNSMFIYEGIQAIYPELYPLYGENPFGIFTSVEQDVECSDIFIGRRDIRLIRRIVEITNFAARPVNSASLFGECVLMNEEKNINPHIRMRGLTAGIRCSRTRFL